LTPAKNSPDKFENPIITLIGFLLHAAHKKDMLLGWMTRDLNLDRETKNFSLAQNVGTGSGAQTASYSRGTGIPSRG